jgi:acetylornithine deacetylase
MTDTRQKVLQQIDVNKEKSLKFLQKIVSIPSVTGDEEAIQKFLADYLTKMGLEVDMWETDWGALKKHPGYIPVDRGYEGRPNIVATWKGTGGGKSLLFNGHTDVIPVGNGEGWSDNPWSASIKDGNLYGRGSCDMKSGVASHIMAVQNMMETGLKPKGHPRLQGGRRHFRRDQRPCGAARLHRPHLV